MTSTEAKTLSDQDLFGPFLFARGADTRTVKLAALVVAHKGAEIPELRANGRDVIAPTKLATLFGRSYWRFDFELPKSRCGL